ncbi:tRNA (N6-threonylcarbamoyladenosine(37)-N6)-methyltransferase TrmO [Labilibaculum manganireducens]|uniref:tRNA (N6-threonylcarbamoyladenosine(37)-N6)-methyltransferase TrmO n=1 Tax=Labilibaculum manganireducens TaxID=1940525 RepID=A0A2N3I6Z4_9BACT|nr:tRNA (N6-threonylcarbamoyladenosine(37)-N6)-methyltransferase TrmO [Labilibaculum manganireducens]PKQ66067.1 tRNA (N6-threonylcarbamoyladenosine(37)-N6)-methyltransferase TrmO [Labilibaculum manganireducens]
MTEIKFESIGVVQTSYKTLENMPIQPMGAKGVKASIVLNDEFVDGLKDLEEFSHITLIYHLHKVQDYKLRVIPFMDIEEHGIFATRSPRRPNAIGISTVKLISIDGNILHVEDADVLDGTPLLDIKPFFGQFDNRENIKSGWLDRKWDEKHKTLKSDERFKTSMD